MGLTKPRASQIFDLDYKQATRVITISDVTLSGGAPSQVDGVNLAHNDRVLVSGQNNAAQNGLYVVSSVGTGADGTWVRTSDGNETGEIQAGMIVMVTEGTSYHDTQWKLTTNDPIVVGTTPLTFVINILSQIGGANTQIQYNNAGSMGGSPNLTWNGTTLYTNGAISATGNITGNYLFGNGSQLTGISGGGSTDASTLTGNTLSANVIYSSLTSVGTLTALSVTGNVTGNQFIGSGGGLTAIPGANVTGTVANATYATSAGTAVTVTANAQPNITSVGTLTSVSVTGNAAVGNLLFDNGVVSGAGNITGGNLLTSGLISATGNITGGNLSGTNVTGTLTTAAQPNITSVGTLSSLSVTGTATVGNVATAGTVSATGNVTGGNVSGTNVTGTLTTASQPNITLIGTLTNLSVTGNVTAGGAITPRVVSIADGTSVTINGDTTDIATQTNTQAVGTLTINPVSGTPFNGQKIIFRLQSTNVQTFSWNGVFVGSTDLALPTTSSGSSKYDYMGFIYNSTALKWQLLAKNFGF